VVGFVSTLGLHWSIRPESQVAQDSIEQAVKSASIRQTTELSDLFDENKLLKHDVSELETLLSKSEEEQSINESRARILMKDIQVFREERDRLFEELQLRQQKLVNKIEELDEAITNQIEVRNTTRPRQTDYELANELTGLLNYPHALNDTEALNAALLEKPAANAEFIQQRFELMVQAPSYEKHDQVYQVVEDIAAQLNKQHENDNQIMHAYCSDISCEIQLSMQRTKPFFDYWQQWQDELTKYTATKFISHQTITERDSSIFASVLLDTH